MGMLGRLYNELQQSVLRKAVLMIAHNVKKGIGRQNNDHNHPIRRVSCNAFPLRNNFIECMI